MTVNLSALAGAGQQFFDNNGNPLSGGKLWSYQAGTTTPQATYTNVAGSVAHTNPIVLDSAGRVATGEIWVTAGANYKFVLMTSTNVTLATWDNITGINGTGIATTADLVSYSPDITSLLYPNTPLTVKDALDELSNPDNGSAYVGFKRSGGGIARTVDSKLTDTVCVFDFMTPAQIAAVKAGTSTEDLSAAIQAAVNTQKRVYLPGGTYKFNLIINNKTVIEGDGSTKTIVKPYNDAVAVMTYTYTAQQNPIFRFWDYHSEIKNIGFFSNSSRTGVGFTFGTTVPSNYTTNMEYANNVHFFGCYFEGFDKGVQFPFGNIGTEIYSCGFTNNKYGVYTIDNKFGGSMHAGCKYFYGGEFNSNDVAIYINNTNTDGFGAISLYGTIIEANKIGIYAYISPNVYVPMNLDSVWFEANGVYFGGTSTIDAWSGTTRSNQTVTNSSIVIDGSPTTGSIKFNIRSGLVPDYHLKASNTQLVCSDCRVESNAGYGGGPGLVDYPDSSYVKFENPYSLGGWWSGDAGAPLPFVTGIAKMDSPILNSGSRAFGRCFQTNARGSKVTNYGPSRAMSAPLTTAATTGSGSFGLTGTVVSDGRIYNQCNEFTRAAFGSGEYTRLDNPVSTITTSAGWYVFTIDFKIVSGAGVKLHVWDRSTVQLATGIMAPSTGKWYTASAIGYSTGGQTLYLDFSGMNGDVTWRVSAYQIHRFDTEMDAWNFIQSNVYAES